MTGDEDQRPFTQNQVRALIATAEDRREIRVLWRVLALAFREGYPEPGREGDDRGGA